MKISAAHFGTLADGRQAMLYTLENTNGMRVEITNFGGNILRLFVPDKNGNLGDVVLGHPNFADYLKNPNFFGALVGRNCNRIGGATVDISGKTYSLDQNNGANNLHGGYNGLSFRLLSAECRIVGSQPVLILTHTMEDMSDGFPGNLTVTIAYALTADNTLMIDYRGVSDQDTVINMTNHSYFNLAGHDSGTIYTHNLQLDAPFFSPGDETCMPTGELKSVADSPFDFRTGTAVGDAIHTDCKQLSQYGGFDHNFALQGQGYRKVGSVTEPGCGRVMEVFTNLPAVQFYTGNNVLPNCPGKDGAVYGPHSGLCLETQFFPNSVKLPWLMSPIFRAGEESVTTTAYRFSTL